MTKGIIISSAQRHGKYLPLLLAKKLEKNEIPVLLSSIAWPRDEIIIHSDGNYDHVSKGTCQGEHRSNFAWNGGTFLKGDDFIIGSLTANPKEKQEATHRALGISRGYYFDISEELNALNFIKVSGKDFFKSCFPHMDIIYNICNTKKILFTYNHEKLVKTGKKMEELTGYNLITIPLEEAKFASVGFIEFGNKIVLDKRAKKTKKILENLDYEIITTSFGLKKINRGMGSLRCVTTEMPIELEKLVMIDIRNIRSSYDKEYLYMRSILFNLQGDIVAQENIGNKLKLKEN